MKQSKEKIKTPRCEECGFHIRGEKHEQGEHHLQGKNTPRRCKP